MKMSCEADGLSIILKSFKITLSDDRITDTLDGIRKETVMAFSWRDWGKWCETLITINSDPAKIKTKHLLNTRLKCYSYTNLFSHILVLIWFMTINKKIVNIYVWKCTHQTGLLSLLSWLVVLRPHSWHLHIDPVECKTGLSKSYNSQSLQTRKIHTKAFLDLGRMQYIFISSNLYKSTSI